MLRAGFAGLILGLVVLSTGCRMCAHPFDYCGPTWTGDGPCCPDDEPRAGSVTAAGAVPVPESTPTPTPAAESGEIDYTMPDTGDVSFLGQATEASPLPVPATAEFQEESAASQVTEPSPTVSETPGWTSSRRTAGRPKTGPRLR